jgi:hypothetical protein
MDLAYNIANTLLNGGTMVKNGKYGYRIRDRNINPVEKVSSKYGYYLKLYALKEDKKQKGVYVVSLQKVRKLSGHTAFKKCYKKQLKSKKDGIPTVITTI